ncbi:HAD family hydrolase [Natrarchaeobius oligotrophus]|uniref:HAD family hydrolase n=1 Tax=Natrarchaeobius chitinivorans TaxID=1679083 RepID=A0A3N6MVY4_NATCH|nr:HAD hydrolase-like protein [Natrarchaeobius chitinivorans]RQH00512.1 HAD family hydrolase [Natrarchaeobius chitinivorans]
MTDYDAVVYDLDGTLVELDVNWSAVATDVLAVYESADVEPPSSDLWTLLEEAGEFGLRAPVESTIAEYERDGARTAPRLDRADELLDRRVPVGVCSLNCERACRIALTEHDLATAVETVVGRDTVATQKPDPEPLLTAVDELDASPGRTLFVGDSRTDEITADRAGTAFEYVA